MAGRQDEDKQAVTTPPVEADCFPSVVPNPEPPEVNLDSPTTTWLRPPPDPGTPLGPQQPEVPELGANTPRRESVAASESSNQAKSTVKPSFLFGKLRRRSQHKPSLPATPVPTLFISDSARTLLVSTGPSVHWIARLDLGSVLESERAASENVPWQRLWLKTTLTGSASVKLVAAGDKSVAVVMSDRNMSALLYFSKPDCHGEILWGEASLPADLPAINDDTCCLTVSRDDRKVALVVGKNIHRYELMPTLKRLRRLDPIPIDLETQSILCKSTISFSHDSEQLIAAFQVRVNSRHSVELRLYTWVDATAVLAWKNQDRITLCMGQQAGKGLVAAFHLGSDARSRIHLLASCQTEYPSVFGVEEPNNHGTSHPENSLHQTLAIKAAAPPPEAASVVAIALPSNSVEGIFVFEHPSPPVLVTRLRAESVVFGTPSPDAVCVVSVTRGGAVEAQRYPIIRRGVDLCIGEDARVVRYLGKVE